MARIWEEFPLIVKTLLLNLNSPSEDSKMSAFASQESRKINF